MSNVTELLKEQNLHIGRMISASKSGPKSHVCVWNANIITKSQGKVWFGDLDLTRDGAKLQIVADTIGERLYVLREHDCRFNTENDPIEELIERSVWTSQ
jgi:hypothetical protein